jgi:mannosyltransferase
MRRFRPVWILGGALLIVLAALWNTAAIENFFGRSPGSLSWGPVLFRALLAFHGLILLFSAMLQRPPEPQPATAEARSPRWIWWTLGAMSIAALALRLWKLGTGLWLDEILTLVDFVRPPVKEILTSFPSQNQHMLYSLMAHACVRLSGESAWSLRLPSVFFGVASVWALFLLGRKIFGVREALLACTLMTFSYHHIWFSQNARGYMGLLFFSILAVWLWLEALERRSPGWWVAFAFSVALGAWTHMTMAFVAAGIGVVYLGGLLRNNSPERRAGRGPWLAWVLVGTLTLQLHALVAPEFLRSALHEVSMPSEWTNPLWVVTESLRSLNVGWSGAGILVCGAAFLLFGWLRLAAKDPRAILIMTLPPLMGGGFMLAASHNLWPRFFFFAMGFALLMVMAGIADVSKIFVSIAWKSRPAMASTLSVAGCGLLIVASALTIPRVYRLPKQDYISAKEYAERIGGGQAGIVAVGLAGAAYGKYYAPHWDVAQTESELESLAGRYRNLTLVYTLPIELKAFHPELWRAVEANFEPVAVFPGTLGGGEVYVCRQRKPVSASAAPGLPLEEVSR